MNRYSGEWAKAINYQRFERENCWFFEQNTEKYKNCNVFRSCDIAILWPQIQLIRNRWHFATKTSFHHFMLKPIIDETCVFHNKALSSENVEANWCLLIILYWTNHSWCHCKNDFEKKTVGQKVKLVCQRRVQDWRAPASAR